MQAAKARWFCQECQESHSGRSEKGGLSWRQLFRVVYRNKDEMLYTTSTWKPNPQASRLRKYHRKTLHCVDTFKKGHEREWEKEENSWELNGQLNGNLFLQ